MKYERLNNSIEIIPINNNIVDILKNIAYYSFVTSLKGTVDKDGSFLSSGELRFPTNEEIIAQGDFSQYFEYPSRLEEKVVEKPRFLQFIRGPKKVIEKVKPQEPIRLKMISPDLWQCRTLIEKKNDKWLFNLIEYSASRTLDDKGYIAQRSPELLLEAAKTSLI